MSRDDRSYDFGMRGYPQTTRPLARRPLRRPRYDPYVDMPYGAMDGDVPPPNRVSQRYNREYVDDRLNAARGYGYGYGGDHVDRNVDESFYRRPYTTIGGTRTMRGSYSPQWGGPGRFGPSYGGRYPDEI